jgi:uncharacterized protein (DUF1810 family)
VTVSSQSDPFDLQRFVGAQNGAMDSVFEELRTGRKHGHWMWFVFPQVVGLGNSPAAVRFAIRSSDEARAYLEHDLLGPRLVKCTRLVFECGTSDIDLIFGTPDNLKFRSSIKLFEHVSENSDSVFASALDRFFDGRPDRRTLDYLASSG